jgi:hypothetical protein
MQRYQMASTVGIFDSAEVIIDENNVEEQSKTRIKNREKWTNSGFENHHKRSDSEDEPTRRKKQRSNSNRKNRSASSKKSGRSNKSGQRTP